VRVERIEHGDPALLAPQQSYFLRENLKLRLLNARLALLQRDGRVFREEIRQAREHLERYFDNRAKPVLAAQSTLSTLAATDVSFDLPGMSETLTALRNLKLARGRRGGEPAARQGKPADAQPCSGCWRCLPRSPSAWRWRARYNEGYVLLVLPPWRAELSLNLFLAAEWPAASCMGSICWLRAVGAYACRLPRAVAEFRRRRQQDKASQALRDAWRLLQEGRYGHALRAAEKIPDDDPSAGILALAGWKAAHAMRDTARRDEWAARLRAAGEPKLDAARLMTEAEFALDDRRFEDARIALNQFAAREGRHIAALRLSLRAEQGLGNWREVGTPGAPAGKASGANGRTGGADSRPCPA
jgi:hypothetical protein